MSLELKFVNLGDVPFSEAEKIQKDFAQKRIADAAEDVIFVATHPPTITLGQTERWNILHAQEKELVDNGISLHRSERGGGATYLGPGQVIFYPVINLKNKGIGVWEYLRKIEESANEVAYDLGMKTELGEEFNSAVGKMYKCVWYIDGNGKKHKFLAQGIRMQNGVITEGGFSIYLTKEAHKHFNLIDHCGFKLDEVGATSFEEMSGRIIPAEEIVYRFGQRISTNLGYSNQVKEKKVAVA